MLGGDLYEWGLLAWIGGLLLVGCIDAVIERARKQALNGEDIRKRGPSDTSDEETWDPGEFFDRSLDENLDSESNPSSAWCSEATNEKCASEPTSDIGAATAHLCDRLEKRQGEAIF